MASKNNGSVPADTKEKPATGKLFTKGQILASSKYRARRDLLDALLEDGREYTLEETDAAVKRFMERKVQ